MTTTDPSALLVAVMKSAELFVIVTPPKNCGMCFLWIRALIVAVILIAASVPVDAIPNFHGCLTPKARSLRYCDATLSVDERVEDLLSHLSLKEQIGLISPNKTFHACYTVVNAVPRIGLPEYMWLTETNTGVSSQCLAPSLCATTFIGPTGLGATFNRTLWKAKGQIMSTEMRALNNANGVRSGKPLGAYPVGLTGFGPNINIVRDPRFGRNSELPSEDPLVAGVYAENMVQGMQEKDSHGNMRMLAYLKHFTAYSTESNRGHDTYNISTFDFFDTYLPQYERAMTKGGASGVMCSYNAENGWPSCANNWLLNDVLRGKWNRHDAVVMTDCGAISNLMGEPINASSLAHAAAFSINNGTDIEAGDTIWGEDGHLQEAIDMGLTNESIIDQALRRAMRQLFLVGRFNPLDSVDWTSIPSSVLNSTWHRQTNFEAASQSFVLLKNEANTLPLQRGINIALLGPNAVSRRGLFSGYFGDTVCYDKNGDRVWYCVPTIADQITAMNEGGKTLVAKGVDIDSQDSCGIPEALGAAKQVDVVVLVLGVDTDSIEHEGKDRSDIALPGLQESFAKQVFAVGKPVVLVLVNGGVLGVDSLFQPSSAIVEAFYPSTEGARALAGTLFGDLNRWGKLPVTMYPASYINEQSMINYDMSKTPGRTYRYYKGKPLFPFGHGLSYTSFKIAATPVAGVRQRESSNGIVLFDIDGPSSVTVEVKVLNTGKVAGDEVIMVYHWVGDEIRKGTNHPFPLKQLVDFERVTLGSGEEALALFTIDTITLSVTNESGDKTVYPGTHFISVETGVPEMHPQVIEVTALGEPSSIA